jgi:hypothetical protein
MRKTAVEVPVFRNGSGAIYALSVTINPEQMAGILKDQNLPKGWVGAIFDNDGILFARSRAAATYVGQRVTPTLFKASRKAMAGTFDGYTIDNVRSTTVFVRSLSSGWGVAIGIPTAELTSRCWHSIAWSVAGVTVFGAVSLLAAHYAGKRITRDFAQTAAAYEASSAELRKPRKALASGQSCSRTSPTKCARRC